MAKFVKVILTLFFAVAFFAVADVFSSDKLVEDQECVFIYKTESQELSNAQLPYLPEGELTNGTQSHQVVTPRMQRVSFLEYSSSLKALVQKLSTREGILTQHLGRIYDTTTSYNCHPASEYYVFALRRILI